jgi:hypothetical protein
MVFGTTLLGPRGPAVNNSVDDFEIPEDGYDFTTINLYHWFSDLNGDKLTFRCEGQKYLKINIHQDTGAVEITPEPDWNGKEWLVFYAFDGNNEASDDVIITVTPENDPPGPAEITGPDEGYEGNDTTPIDLTGSCGDADLIYGDVLKFKWYSNISGELGEGPDVKGMTLPIGVHQITLMVSDIFGETAVDMIDITVFSSIPFINDTINDTGNITPPDGNVTDPDGPDGTKGGDVSDLGNTAIYVSLAIVVIVIILVILFFLFKKKKLPFIGEGDKEVKTSVPVPVPVTADAQKQDKGAAGSDGQPKKPLADPQKPKEGLPQPTPSTGRGPIKKPQLPPTSGNTTTLRVNSNTTNTTNKYQ